MNSYTPQEWANGSGGGTPLSAARLSHIESGVLESLVADGSSVMVDLTAPIEGPAYIAFKGAPNWLTPVDEISFILEPGVYAWTERVIPASMSFDGSRETFGFVAYMYFSIQAGVQDAGSYGQWVMMADASDFSVVPNAVLGAFTLNEADTMTVYGGSFFASGMDGATNLNGNVYPNLVRLAAPSSSPYTLPPD